jgi:hypothetical protein
MKVVTRYRIAMTYGSVVWSIFRNRDPLAARRAGYGCDVIGLGATAVTGPPART